MSTGVRLVTIFVGDRPVVIPLGTSLLSSFEQISGRVVTEGNYCWTGECGHCEVAYRVGAGPERTAMACRLAATDGLRVTTFSRYLETDLRR